QVRVSGGALSWRDDMVKPRAALDFSGVEANVTGVSWPLTGPLGVRAGIVPPGGGRVDVSGRVELNPLAADLRLGSKNAELAPYRPYVPTPAHISGRADLDVAVKLPPIEEGRAMVRGRATLSHGEVRDEQRTAMRVDRADVT